MSQYTGMREGEFFAGNTDSGIGDDIKHLPTVRLGDVALDIEGRKLPPEYRPIFIGKVDSDRYDSIRMAGFRAIRGGRYG